VAIQVAILPMGITQAAIPAVIPVATTLAAIQVAIPMGTTPEATEADTTLLRN